MHYLVRHSRINSRLVSYGLLHHHEDQPTIASWIFFCTIFFQEIFLLTLCTIYRENIQFFKFAIYPKKQSFFSIDPWSVDLSLVLKKFSVIVHGNCKECLLVITIWSGGNRCDRRMSSQWIGEWYDDDLHAIWRDSLKIAREGKEALKASTRGDRPTTKITDRSSKRNPIDIKMKQKERTYVKK